jgi:hypothetical protein
MKRVFYFFANGFAGIVSVLLVLDPTRPGVGLVEKPAWIRSRPWEASLPVVKSVYGMTVPYTPPGVMPTTA